MPAPHPYVNSPRLAFSPYGLALLSYALFLITWLIPSAWYTELLAERNYLFLDPGSMMLYTLCVSAFLAGLAVIDIFLPTRVVSPPPLTSRIRPSLLLLIPLVLGTTVTIESIVLLLRDNPSIVYYMLSQQAYQIKETVDIHQPLGLASIYLLGICWWASWRKAQFDIAKRWERWLLSLAIGTALSCIVTSATLRLSRGDAITVVAGTGLLYLLRKNTTGSLTPRIVRRRVLLGAIVVLGLFALFAVVRGSDNIVVDMLLYTVTSANRLAALVNGRLHYPYAGHGVYLSPFVSFNTTVNTIVPIADIMHWPRYEDMWESEFTATWQAGLNGALIWSGTFGYLFAEVGWLAPLAVSGYGLLYGFCWRSVRLGRTVGIVLYPWLGALVFLWFSTNNLFDTRSVVLVLVSLGLACYERLFVIDRGAVRRRAVVNMSVHPEGVP